MRHSPSSASLRALERVLPEGHGIVVTGASSAEEAPSVLPKILNRAGPLEASRPQDSETIEKGRVNMAAPDHHTLVEDGRVRMARGLNDNRHRPAVDPLLRSAAVAYSPQVVGVILTGARNDGTSGLLAVKRLVGIAVV